MKCLRLIPLFVVAVAVLAGCGHSQPYVNAARLQRGLVIVLPGIEGRSYLNRQICAGLDAGGVNYAIELLDWTSPLPLTPLYNLKAESRNRRRSAEIADRIVRYQLTYPGRPVVLVGQSGGGAIAAWAAENMMPSRQVDGIIMLAGNLSRSYPLDLALRKSKRGIVSFHSDRDWILPVTRIAGTMDGRHEATGGREGFRVPRANGMAEEYRKLYQIAWNPEMSEAGNSGGHLSSGAGVFVAAYVAPLVLAPEWDMPLITRIQSQRFRQPASQPHPAPHPVSESASGKKPSPPSTATAPQAAPSLAPASTRQLVQELSCTLEVVHVSSGIVAARVGRTGPSDKLDEMTKKLAVDIRGGVPMKGRSIIVASFRDLGESEPTRALTDDLAARLTGALSANNYFRVKEPLYLRGIYKEEQLDQADIASNPAMKEILAGTDYLVIGRVSVFSPAP